MIIVSEQASLLIRCCTLTTGHVDIVAYISGMNAFYQMQRLAANVSVRYTCRGVADRYEFDLLRSRRSAHSIVSYGLPLTFIFCPTSSHGYQNHESQCSHCSALFTMGIVHCHLPLDNGGTSIRSLEYAHVPLWCGCADGMRRTVERVPDAVPTCNQGVSGGTQLLVGRTCQ
jgi:hypothetical protein